MKSWERFGDMVTAAEEAGQERARQLVREGRMPTLYLYYKATDGGKDGALTMFDDSDTVPEGWTLATSEGLRCNLSYGEYWSWIRARALTLPILGDC